jgi:hypothetical protein
MYIAVATAGIADWIFWRRLPDLISLGGSGSSWPPGYGSFGPNRVLPHSRSRPMNLRFVLVRPRNPLNIGAAARAMANFGFNDLAVVKPYAPVWRETTSRRGAEQLVREARGLRVDRRSHRRLSFGGGHHRPSQSPTGTARGFSSSVNGLFET